MSSHLRWSVNCFTVTIGVKQGCILSPFLFTLAVNWLMTETTKNCRTGIQWTLTTVLEDLDYADDIDLLSSRHKDIQDKTHKMVDLGGSIGLAVNVTKTKMMRNNNANQHPIYINNEPVEEVKSFVYLGSCITPEGDSEKDAEARIIKANQVFGMLKPFWRNTKICTETKLRIYRSNILGVLLYGSECWKVTSNLTNKLETFQNKCLRNILNIYWPNIISNQALLQSTSCSPIATLVKKRRWMWIGHVCRMPSDSIPRTALRWTADGKRKRGRPRETWRRSVEKELKAEGMSWESVTKLAQDRGGWRTRVEASCADVAQKRTK